MSLRTESSDVVNQAVLVHTSLSLSPGHWSRTRARHSRGIPRKNGGSRSLGRSLSVHFGVTWGCEKKGGDVTLGGTL
jgi:hypothetical protein